MTIARSQLVKGGSDHEADRDRRHQRRRIQVLAARGVPRLLGGKAHHHARSIGPLRRWRHGRRGASRTVTRKGRGDRSSSPPRSMGTTSPNCLARWNVYGPSCGRASRCGSTVRPQARSVTTDAAATRPHSLPGACSERLGLDGFIHAVCGSLSSRQTTWWPPASLITLITGRKDFRTSVLDADEAPRFSPDATIFRIERMGMAHFGRNALAAVGTDRAERGIGFGSELRSLLGHRPHQAWVLFSQYPVTYTSTSTSAPCTRTG